MRPKRPKILKFSAQNGLKTCFWCFIMEIYVLDHLKPKKSPYFQDFGRFWPNTGWPLILELLENTWIYWKNISYWNYTWKNLLFRKKVDKLKNIMKLYWNFEILILENTGIILTRLIKWTSLYSALNSSRWPLFEYISLKIPKSRLRRAFNQNSDT